jgi:hypothetical protein
MATLHNSIKQQWLEQAQQDIRELRHEGTPESLQMAQLLQEALDECLLETVNPVLYREGSSQAQSDDLVMAGALDFIRSRRPH